ncbi:MAG: aldehyde dehydrogenase family protein [Rhizobacter sp.]|nr:aldehyde dehydrogenase family protein [Rhizobacter sp.]
MSTPRLLIGGLLVEGAQTMTVINPATEEPVATAPRVDARQINEAVAAAKAALPGWAARPIDDRREMLLKVAAVIDTNAEELARLLTQEQGKPLAMAKREVAGLSAFFRYATKLNLAPRVLEDSPNRRVELHRRPLGVVAAIIPWNFPLLLLGTKLPTALLAGNTVVVKPAATTPLSTLRLGELLVDVVPPGVLNVIADANDLGDVLTRHPDVRKVSFTGSTATGVRVMTCAAETLKRVTLELGGNDAAIVLDDVDPGLVAPGLFMAAFINSGQACIAIKRLYVHEKIYDSLVVELSKLANAAVVGDGLAEGTTLGPLQNRAQYEKVKDILDEARKLGTVVAGGMVENRSGFFIRPTIVRDIAEGSRLVDEEQFGPVLPVIKYTDVQDAVRRANASPYGLGGSVWSADTDRALSVASQLECGTAWINKHCELLPNVPLGGAKCSGMGLELAEEGLAEFTQVQVLSVGKTPAEAQPRAAS